MADPPDRIYLSPPHMGGEEMALLRDAFESNWIAPLGPHVDAFEAEFAARVGTGQAVALSSGTAALHLALQLVGVEGGDEVLVSDLTFVASVNPVRYLDAVPILIDAERSSWNLDPALVEERVRDGARRGTLPAAIVVVHLYGQSADLDPILRIAAEFGVPVVEDAAEALGATYLGGPVGRSGAVAVFSFNGNKIITTSGGGMLTTGDADLAVRARKLSTQARDPAPHYEHSELGYNYRMSNLLAAVGRGQLRALDGHVEACRRVFDRYRSRLEGLDGIQFQPEAPWGRHTRWLTCALVDAETFGCGPADIMAALEAENIEARPLWKPMHLQPLYRDAAFVGTGVSADLFARGICLPSGSALTNDQVDRIADIVARSSRHQ